MYSSGFDTFDTRNLPRKLEQINKSKQMMIIELMNALLLGFGIRTLKFAQIP